MSQLFTSFLLLIPGLLSAAGYLWLGTGRAIGIAKGDSAAFLLLVPWQLLGLTISKFGVDAWALARASNVAGFRIDIRALAATKIMPAAVLYGLLLALRFPLAVCVAIALSVVFDSLAVIVAAEISGKGGVRRVANAHLLRLPLFFFLAFSLALTRGLTTGGLLILMCVTAAVRLCALLAFRRASKGSPESPPSALGLAWQQVLNYGLFKNDQLLFSFWPAWMTAAHQAAFVFFARFPELVSAAINALGPQIYPRLSPSTSRIEHAIAGRTAPWFWMGMTVLVLTGAFIFALFAPRHASSLPLLAMAVGCHALLILPSNLTTYRLMRENEIRLLNVASQVANLLGLVIGLVALYSRAVDPSLLLWVVPIQQAMYLGATRLLVGRRMHSVVVARE